MIFKLADRYTLSRLDFKDPSVWAATWMGCGLMRPAPGTWGTLGALPFGVGLMFLGIPYLLLASILIFAVGYWASGKVERMTGEKDASLIVIDEAVGVWIALIPASLSPLSVFWAFILFRAFDVFKPWPVSWFDQKMTGAASVMLDDVMAGIYAALCLIGLRYAGLA